MRIRSKGLLPLTACVAAHASIDAAPAGVAVKLGGERWRPPGVRESKLAGELHTALEHDHVLGLILFGSQARGGTTGFSDVDAVLVISDNAAEDSSILRTLRPRVLGAQRAVLEYQPMQHHGFEIVTPRLLMTAGAALDMPAVALSETRSATGGAVTGHFNSRDHVDDPRPLRSLVRATARIGSWPSHPWALHRAISMLELVPTLYLQARGHAIPKSQSFAAAREEFGQSWWPYDRLNEVRERWPAVRRPWLRRASSLIRNPWLVVEGWRRLPKQSTSMHHMLDQKSLEALQKLGARMEAAAS
jgi:hypothetical protein